MSNKARGYRKDSEIQLGIKPTCRSTKLGLDTLTIELLALEMDLCGHNIIMI